MFVFISDEIEPDPTSFNENIQYPLYPYTQTDISDYSKYDTKTLSKPEKRFWTNRFWSLARSYRAKPWPRLNRKLDKYRFVMKGLGKRRGHFRSPGDTRTYMDDSEASQKFIICKNCEKDFGLIGENDALERHVPDKPFRDDISSTEIYSDILDSLNKRTPEIYKQDWYPIQGGTQRMEVEMDRKLDELVLDNVIRTGGHILDSDEHDFNQYDADLPHNKHSTVNTDSIYNLENTQLPLDTDKRDGEEEMDKEKKWWAARRLKLFGLKTPKSIRARRYQRPHIDPTLYLIGLGR